MRGFFIEKDMPIPYVSPKFQAIDANGKPLVGGKLYTYTNQTTTPQTTYQDAAGTINNTNPIILDGRGEAIIFLAEQRTYTFVLRDSQDALVWSQDGIAGSGGSSSGIIVVTALPSADVGPVYLAGQGIYSWNGTKYVSDYSVGFGSGAYSSRNRLINGCFRIWQRALGFGPITAASGNPYTADRWRAVISGTASIFVSQQAASTDYGQGRVGGYSALIASSVASTPAAADKNRFVQPIEGQNILALALGSLWGGSFTMSFWVKASIVGTYSVAFLNGGSPGFRSYIANYSVSAAGVWEMKTITVPIDPSGAANWNRGANVGMQVIFDLGSGSLMEGAANTWLSTESTRTTGSVRTVSTNGATLELSNVQLEFGATATPFEERHVATELQNCLRYFEMSYPLGTTPGSAPLANGSHASVAATQFILDAPTANFMVPKRAVPSIAIYSPQTGALGSISEYNSGGTFVADRTVTAAFLSLLAFEISGQGTITAANLTRTHWVANAEL